MTLSLQPNLITEIANRAANLADYLKNSAENKAPSLPDALSLKRCENWRETITGSNDDPDVFELRLKATGLDKAQILARLGSKPLKGNQGELPAWTSLLHDLFEVSPDLFSPDLTDPLEIGDPDRTPVAFDQVLQPFVRLFRRKLFERAGKSLEILTASLMVSLERDLLEALSELASPALAVEFSVYKTQTRPGGFFGLFKAPPESPSPDPSEPLPDRLYQKFIKSLLDNRLQKFFLEYSSLARLLCLKTGFFLDASKELLQRLTSDLPEIERLFGHTGGRLINLTGGLSDPHDRGRTVYRLEFSSGLKLVYKPRDLTLEAAFQDFLKWYNARQSEGALPLKTIGYLVKKDYGWVEFVEHRPCRNGQEVRNYYRRCGVLLAVLHVLQGKDYHYENLIANGEFPVPIDQEALMTPQQDQPGEAGQSNSVSQFLSSVLSIGILPTWEITASGHIRDIGALGEASENDRAYLKRGWQDINTDRMQTIPLKVASSDRTGLNRPIFQGKAVPVDSYVNEFTAGFEQAYRDLLAAKEELLSNTGPLQIFKDLRGRVILRPTRIYGTLLHQANNPRLMTDGLKRSFHFDKLSKAFLIEGTNPLHWQILSSEVESLEQLDLPFFSCATTSTALFLARDLPVPGYFYKSGFEAVKNTVERLSEADFQLQLNYVRASFYMISAGSGSATQVVQDNRDAVKSGGDSNFISERADFLEVACKLGRELEQKGIWTGNSLSWVFTGYDKRIERFQITPVDNSLYSGQAGPALFFAALAAATADPGFRRLALAAWQPYFRLFKEKSNQRHFLREEGPGGGVGAGSILYSLALSAGFLQEAGLAELALELADFPAELIANDRKYDLIFGSAGALVSLLALYEYTGEKGLLETAKKCGNHLVASRQPSQSGLRAWITLDQKFGTGFSHGSAGIAYALLRLYKLTGGREYLEAASEAIEYEDNLFSPEARNWPYLFYQKAGTESFWARWCHGAPGIGLGRLGGLDGLDTPAIRADIETALNTTFQEGIIDTDHLCCGNFGLVELLVSAGVILDRPHLLQAARERASQVVDRATRGNESRFLIFPGNPSGLYSPAFFQGNSGIGYELLRLADPAKFPSVLLWQSQEKSYVKS